MINIKIEQGDNLQLLKYYPDNSVDSVVTDAPYGLGKEPDAIKLLQDWIDHGYHEIKGSGFMGKSWDAFVPQPILWKEVFRVLKPGGYLLCFFGTRTYDWGTLAIRLAGFEIRDMICWHYGSGFPKSMDVSKAFDKDNGADREVTGTGKAGSGMNPVKGFGKNTTKAKIIKCCRNCEKQLTKIIDLEYSYECKECDESFFEFETIDKEINVKAKKEWDTTKSSSDEAKKWDGYGTALKPATEPICVARKPLIGTVIQNIREFGTGAINIDGCRIETDDIITNHSRSSESAISKGKYGDSSSQDTHQTNGQQLGRFPANVIFDPITSAILDEQTGVLTSGKPSGVKNATNNIYGEYGIGIPVTGFGDSGGASRFFYCAKASQDERNAGLENFDRVKVNDGRTAMVDNAFQRGENERLNFHPTVKPISLIRYLQRLVTPKGGITLDLFAGSGTSGCAAALEGFDIILMELTAEYIPIIEARTSYWQKEAERQNRIKGFKKSQVSLF